MGTGVEPSAKRRVKVALDQRGKKVFEVAGKTRYGPEMQDDVEGKNFKERMVQSERTTPLLLTTVA
jgi:hypothetical protein